MPILCNMLKFLIIILGILFLMKSNFLYTMCLLSIIAIPLAFLIILEFKTNNKKYILSFFQLFSDIIFKFSYLILIAIWLVNFIILNIKIETENIFEIALYFTLIFGIIILINYYALPFNYKRKNIKKFLFTFKKFIKENFMVTLLVIITIVYLSEFNSMLISIVTSYLFYFLTELNRKYNSSNPVKKSNTIISIFIVLLNISILYLLTDIKMIINHIISNEIIQFDLNFFLKFFFPFIFIVVIRIFGKKLEIALKKVSKFLS